MILLVHKDDLVVEIIDLRTNQSLESTFKPPAQALFNLAKHNKERILVWCHQSQRDYLNIEGFKTSFYLKNMMLSFSKNQYLPEQIGYVEDSPFLKINNNVKYPTWLMSSEVGAIHASQLIKFESVVNIKNTFNFVLNSIAKIGMPNGLFCYSEPKLLTEYISISEEKKASISELFKFVKYHYKGIWSFLLCFNFLVHEKKFPLLAFLKTIFIKRKNKKLEFDLKPINVSTIDAKKTIDVIIPTLGRKKYLLDVLQDLSKQTLLPKQVIIVEQNEDKHSESELEYISTISWPFKIVHKFIHQCGACNARNMALKLTTADYIYLADDDNKFHDNLLKGIMHNMLYFGFKSIAMSYLQKNEVEKHKNVVQWSAFGGGSSVISSKYLKDVAFNMVYEFGYGEDTDFGMQLRNLGADVIYMPFIKILHLKAPIGGFRTKFIHPWEKDKLQPKPSPTVMHFRMNHTTKQQLQGYKTTLFLKFYKSQNVKNPFKYYNIFKKQWKQSILWVNQL